MSLTLRQFVHRSILFSGLFACLIVLVSCVGSTGSAWPPSADADEMEDPEPEEQPPAANHLNFESPHAKPIAVHPTGDRVYVVNTPADTVDVIDSTTYEVVSRVHVGIDPVSVAIRPDGEEVWVSNHVSDSVSVIDALSGSPTYHQVLHTIQVFDAETRSTRFDEPVAIAFANNEKAYVALSSENDIAVIDVNSREITQKLNITAQDPRAIAIHDDRLYVIPFESNNQTAVSGCLPENLETDPLCTFDADAHVVNAPDGNAQSLSLNYVLDIVRDSRIPDRDLYVFDTETDQRVEIVDTLGTLLYGIAIDSNGVVFVAQAEARNDANGKAGTEKHGLDELENRAFLNQITKIDCSTGTCSEPEFIDLEPLPPEDPAREDALATPFGIQISDDDATIVATAAASNKVFTFDTASGTVLDQVIVDSIPRGLSLIANEEGELDRAFVLNALANTVSVVDVSDRENLAVLHTTTLEDPSDPILKQGRIAFNSADASSTGTFACASCHPDGHTDQLLWVLDTPLCDVGCDQIQPRLVQDIRGLRGTAPYHWDGIPGDPFGGINTSSIEAFVEPNCEIDDEESCTRQLIDGSLETTMCDQEDCITRIEEVPCEGDGCDANEACEGDDCTSNEDCEDDDCPTTNEVVVVGHLSEEDRAAMAKYLLSVPYPPSVERPYDNVMTDLGMQGVKEFHYTKQCGNCHLLPHWTTTNMGGSGMDLPSWRGANDRWKNAPQNRFFFADFVSRDTQGFPERNGFTQSKEMYQMILEGSIGVPGSFARQLTLNSESAQLEETADLLDALELADREEAIVLAGVGVLIDDDDETTSVELAFEDPTYKDMLDDTVEYSRDDLLTMAQSGELLVTLTAKLGAGVDYEHPQPTLWPTGFPIRLMFPGDRPQEFPELYENPAMRLHGDYIFEGARLYVDGRRVEGTISCESGELPDCDDNIVWVELDQIPSDGGIEMDGVFVVPEVSRMHLLQVQNPHGLFSNDFPFFVAQRAAPIWPHNLISSRGTFDGQGSWRAYTPNGSVSWDGEAYFQIDVANVRQPWRVSMDHDVSITEGVGYSICYTARSDAYRYIQVNVDTGPGGAQPYRTLLGTGHDPEVGGGTRPVGASLNSDYRQFHHRFVADASDKVARITFNMAQSDIDVRIDNVGLYFGRSCGTP